MTDTPLGEPGLLTRDINVLPLIDVLLVLVITFFLLNRGFMFIPAQVPAETAGHGSSGVPIVLEIRKDGSYALNRQPIPEPQLDTQLHAIYDNRPVKLLFVKVNPDRPYQELISAMDRARGAGVQVLALMPGEGNDQKPR